MALHEFGHSLGLRHSDPDDGIPAIMDPFYSGPVSGLHQQDIDRIQGLYPEPGNPVTKLDPNDNPWASTDITYSYMPDGAQTDKAGKKGRSDLFEVMDAAFEGDTAAWQAIMESALATWAAATEADGADTVLTFTEAPDSGRPFNYLGDAQGDGDAGDIRIGAHKFDGELGVLAHAYFPPPNGSTAAGDAHFASEEAWADLSSAGSLSSGSGGSSGGGEDHRNTGHQGDHLTFAPADQELAPHPMLTPALTSSLIMGRSEAGVTPRSFDTAQFFDGKLPATESKGTNFVSQFYATEHMSDPLPADDAQRDAEELETIDLALAEWPLDGELIRMLGFQ